MTTISGFAEGILDGTIPPERERDSLEIIVSETRRLSRLVRRMLDVRHLSGGTRSDESVFGTLYPAIVRLFYGFLRRVRKTFRSWWRDVRGAFGSLAKRSSSCGKESMAKGRYLGIGSWSRLLFRAER